MRPSLLRGTAHAVRPDGLTLVLLALLVALSLAWTVESSALLERNGDAFLRASYGRGLLEVTQSQLDGVLGPTELSVRWLPFLGAVGVLYLAARILAAAAESLAGGIDSPLRWLASGVALTILASFVVASVWSRVYWGYVLRRPAVSASVAGLEVVETLAFVSCERREGTYTCSPDPDRSLLDSIDSCAGDPYECLSGRISYALSEARSLPKAGRPLSRSHLNAIAGVLAQPGRLAAEDPGYSGNRILGGVAAVGLSRSRRPVLVFGVRGTEVANDHYPYYEALISLTGPEPRVLRFRTIFHDIAGIEGFEWPQMFRTAILIGLPVLAPLSLIVGVGVGWRRKRRRARVPATGPGPG